MPLGRVTVREGADYTPLIAGQDASFFLDTKYDPLPDLAIWRQKE